jgi:aspartate/methionine/tyrosine aminotransferase
MDLPPFLLNDWLEGRHDCRFDLAGSAGPRWTIEQLLRLGGNELAMADLPLSYAPTAGLADLKSEIAAYHGVDPDWVVVTTGASEALLLLLSALSRPDGNVLLPTPCYASFAGTARFTHLEPRYYRCLRDQRFSIDLEQVVAMADSKTVLVVANSPHNPTGAVLGTQTCTALAERLGGKGVPLVVDEVFHSVYFGEHHQSAAGIDNVIVIGDMSKALSMPGLRLGWVVDADPDRRARMVRARSYIAWSGSPILERLALHALQNRAAILERVFSVASRNLDELRRFMADVGDVLAWVPPQSGMVAFPWLHDGRDSRPFCERLAERGVLIAPGDCFGMPEHVRIGFGSQVDGISPALGIMAEELRSFPTAG